jgi:hypothetical protein
MDRPGLTLQPADRAASQAQALLATLSIARTLVQSRRRIDLAGLDQEVGRLCAATLDLPIEQGRTLRPQLAAVLAELDALLDSHAAVAKAPP